jgi:hypothetical protein
MHKTKIKGQKSRALFTIHYLLVTFILCLAVMDLPAQSGGTFEIRQSVLAGGGGESSGGTCSVAGTSGQAVANSSSGSPYSLRSGFWQGDLAPSAALVTLSGRVTTADGRGIRNVRVSITDQNGNVRYALTSSFGYYLFDDIAAGQTVVISIAAKRYVFANPTRILSVQEGLADIDFTAEP